VVRAGLYRRRSGITRAVTTTGDDRPGDDLLEEQEGTGYGEDEGERDDALDAEIDE
jgi:hypothetical protein